MAASGQEPVGVVGLGRMGGGIAESLVRSGRPVTVFDLRPEAREAFRGRAEIADSAAALARAVDVVVVAVVNARQVREVLAGAEGLIAGGNGSLVVVVVSTVTADEVSELAAEAAAGGIRLVDVGITGGQSGARAGTLVSLVGCDEDLYPRLRPVLEDFSSQVVHFGPVTSGARAKVVRSLITYISICAAFEGRRLARLAGVDLDKLTEVVRVSDAHIGGVAGYLGKVEDAVSGPDEDAYREVEAGMVGLYLALQSRQAEADVRGMSVSIDTLVKGIPGLLNEAAPPAHP